MQRNQKMFVVALFVLLLAPSSFAQYTGDLNKMCQDRASQSVNVSTSNVSIRRGENLNNGNFIILWEARPSNGRSVNGYCEADPRRSQIVRFEKGDYQGNRPGGGWPGGAFPGGNNAEQACGREAARRLNLDQRNIGTDRMRDASNGNARVKWYTDNQSGKNQSGECEVDRSGRVVDFDRDGGNYGGNWGNGDWGNGNWGNGGRPVSDRPRVKVDTEGRGTFNGGGYRNSQISRGYVNTESDQQQTIRFTGRSFNLTLYGYVDGKVSDRIFTMTITGCDRGNARGRARVRLNGDRNEVEMIDVEGRLNRDDFSGKFNRS